MTKKELLQLVSDLSKKLEVALATIVALKEEIKVLKLGKTVIIVPFPHL
jgi:regulator of replication initiation timing